jgi:hypothetical protein
VGNGNDDAQASFSLNLEGDKEVPDELAKSLEDLRAKIVGGTDKIKAMSAAFRSLKGDTDQVKGAKDQLKAKITAERDALSAANLQLLKQGVTYEQLAQKAKKLAAEKKKLEDANATKKFAEGLRAGGTSVDGFLDKFGTLKTLATGANAGLGLVALGIGLVIAAAGLATAKFVELTASLATFVTGAANAARAMGLMREAASGSEENAANLGTQVDRLAGKLSTPKEKLNELATSLTKALSGTQVSGEGIVNTFEAVARASDAMGDDVGAQLADLVKRGKTFGRVSINPFELQGTGLPSFDAIAAKISKNMKISADQARQSLLYGVKVNDFAQAAMEASVDRYGKVNAKKFLDLDVIMAKFHERLRGLVPQGFLDPILKNLDRLSELFDKDSVTGEALATLLGMFGKGLAEGAEGATPVVVELFEDLEIGALKSAIMLVRLEKSFKKTFGFVPTVAGLAKAAVIGVVIATAGAAIAVTSLAAGLVGLAGAVAILGPIAGLALIFTELYRQIVAFKQEIRDFDFLKQVGKDFEDFGAAIITGIKNGITKTWENLKGAVLGVADSIKDAFRNALGVHSPSRVTYDVGRMVGKGAELGLRSKTRDVGVAARSMGEEVGDEVPVGIASGGARGVSGAAGAPGMAGASGTDGGASAPAAAGGGSVTMQINVSLKVEVAQGAGKEAAAAFRAPSLRADIVKLFEDAGRAMAVPTQATVTG